MPFICQSLSNFDLMLDECLSQLKWCGVYSVTQLRTSKFINVSQWNNHCHRSIVQVAEENYSSIWLCTLESEEQFLFCIMFLFENLLDSKLHIFVLNSYIIRPTQSFVEIGSTVNSNDFESTKSVHWISQRIMDCKIDFLAIHTVQFWQPSVLEIFNAMIKKHHNFFL